HPPMVASAPPIEFQLPAGELSAAERSAAGASAAGTSTAGTSASEPGKTESAAAGPSVVYDRLLPLGRRGVGRHAVPGRIRTPWEANYLRLLVASDLLAALAAGGFAFGARFGNDVTPYNQSYLVFSLILPLIFMVSLALNRAYERRFLFVGTDEYQRVL